ncbi:hypothetical protein X801_07430 [Opisthorchis viverrini]|uniref:Uncharacterized protein n=1 Tax=Opisthorchis viverrini TaxID=6198 RepID=A0A1S8WQQ9_OPIVI|nr:hypothetical protein X801_07430 [Opisthorchis viverrini]
MRFYSSDYRINVSDPVGKVLGIYPAGPSMSTAMALLVTALLLKLLLTVFTFGIKVPTGLFIPSLAWIEETFDDSVAKSVADSHSPY